jgi:hypothetical protein
MKHPLFFICYASESWCWRSYTFIIFLKNSREHIFLKGVIALTNRKNDRESLIKIVEELVPDGFE